MILNLTLFIFGLLLACAMIARKMWLLRTGKILAGSYEEADWTDLSVEKIRFHFVEMLKIGFHNIVLFSLKTWILFIHFIRRTDERVKNKLIHHINKNGQHVAEKNKKPSEFLSDIKDHKDKMMEGVKKDE